MSIVNLTDLPGNMTGDLVLASEEEKDDPPAQMPTTEEEIQSFASKKFKGTE